MLPSGYTVVKALEEDVPQLIQFMFSDFFLTNPMNQVLETPKEVTTKVFTDLITRGAKSGFSYFIQDENNEIVAFRNALPRFREEIHYVKHNEEECVNPIVLFSKIVDERFDFWNRIPSEIERVLWISVISVHRNHARKGLAKYLLSFDESSFISHSFGAICANAGAYYSQKLFHHLSYSVLCTVLHSDVKYPNGNRILTCLDQTDRSELVCKLCRRLL